VTAPVAVRDGVFGPEQAKGLIRSDRQHWWFQCKATIVGDLIGRFAPRARGPHVDLGSGAGGVTALLADPGSVAVAVEGSEELSRHCSWRGLAALRATAGDVPLVSGCARAVTLLDVLEHLADPIPVLREARRLLRPDGVVIVTVPAHRWLWSDADVLLGHVKRYQRALLSRELETAGFEVVSSSHVFSWLALPVLVARRAARSSAEEQLGLEVDGSRLSAMARTLTRAELALTRRWSLPVGTSIACVARPRLETDQDST
jgi:SAM-dependent methyltransferase